MAIKSNSKPTLLWIAIKLFDKSVDKATFLEMMNSLALNYDVLFLTGWRDKPLKIKIGNNQIKYFSQFGTGIFRKATRRLLLAYSIKKYIKSITPDFVLINCNEYKRALKVITRLKRKFDFTAIMDVRTLPTDPNNHQGYKKLKRCLQFACRKLDGITYITEELRIYCLKRFDLPQHKFCTWSSGVNPDLFQFVETKPELPFKLIYHGGILSSCRGIDNLIIALDMVRDLNIQLVLISSLREEKTINLIDSLNLKDRVTLLPTMPYEQIPGEIAKCHAGILPFPENDAWKTSSPLKLFEYLACGKPVIVTDIPAHRNVLKNHEFAFYSVNSSPEAIAAAIRKAYSVRENLRGLGVEARRFVIQEYTWAQQAAKLSKFLNSFLNT